MPCPEVAVAVKVVREGSEQQGGEVELGADGVRAKSRKGRERILKIFNLHDLCHR